MRQIHALYGALNYVIFLVSFLYAIAFVGDFVVPRTIDSPAEGSVGIAIVINLLALGLFAVQHSVMARPAFKRMWTRWVPEPIERSTYVLFSSLLLLLIFAVWQPIPATVWDVRGSAFGLVLSVLFWVGWAIVLTSTFMISHFELFGLTQIWNAWRGRAMPKASLQVRFLYRFVRHPIMLGFMIAFWATPHMTAGHLLFAVMTTGYIVVGVLLEESDLVDLFGESYRRYRRTVPMLLPFCKRGGGVAPATPALDDAALRARQ